MLLLKPVSMERVWGTSRLHNYSGDSSIERIGGVYTVSATDEICCTIENQEYRGMRLDDFIEQNYEMLGLNKGEDYPVIISFTGNNENCSIQIHPTDEYAKSKGLPYGKDESWFFIEEPKDGYIYAEAKIKDFDKIREHSEKGEFEEIVNRTFMKKGDVIYIPSGTIHALTEGSLVYEIQQATDITYRFYDYDRLGVDGNPRPLQLDDAIATMEVHNKAMVESLSNDGIHETQSYNIEKRVLTGEYKNSESIAQAITALDGETKVQGLKFSAGLSILVMPNETVKFDSAISTMIATPKRY